MIQNLYNIFGRGKGYMCGIVGYIGEAQAAPILLAGLGKLEYRGYDSAGIAVRNEETGKIEIVKEKGRLRALVRRQGQWKSSTGYLWCWSYPMGDPWRAICSECSSPLYRGSFCRIGT